MKSTASFGIRREALFSRPAWLTAIAVTLPTFAPANAGISFYSNRTSWETAIGSPGFTENFESFAADVDFSFGTTSLPNGFSLSHIGSNNFRNLIDVPPIGFGNESNGTSSASIYVNGDPPVDTVTITLDINAVAFGFDLSDVSGGGGEGSILSLSGSPAANATSMNIASGVSGFYGFIANGGDFINTAQLKGQGNSSGGEGLFLDNFAGVSVPEPSLFALAAFGPIGICCCRRTRV
jgi:hypothetical protein